MSKDPNSNAVIHLVWTVAVLILSAAALIVYTPNGAIIRDYISFASAISSIVLAVVAIFYSMISNQGFSETIGSLKASSENSASAAQTLNETSIKLAAVADSLVSEISQLNPKFDEISSKISQSGSPEKENSNGEDRKENNSHRPLGLSISRLSP